MPKGKARTDDGSRELAVGVARLADELNCEDILVLDLRDVSQVTDYFVICTGTSDRQMRAVAQEIRKHGKETGNKPWHIEGERSDIWVLVDFVDVVVHVFEREQRTYYDLELIWGEAPRVEWRR